MKWQHSWNCYSSSRTTSVLRAMCGYSTSASHSQYKPMCCYVMVEYRVRTYASVYICLTVCARVQQGWLILSRAVFEWLSVAWLSEITHTYTHTPIAHCLQPVCMSCPMHTIAYPWCPWYITGMWLDYWISWINQPKWTNMYVSSTNKECLCHILHHEISCAITFNTEKGYISAKCPSLHTMPTP